jgi:hypothetical protein
MTPTPSLLKLVLARADELADLWGGNEGCGISPSEFNVSTIEKLIENLFSAISANSKFEDTDPILGKFEVLVALTTVVLETISGISCHSCREQAVKMIQGLWPEVLPDVENLKAEMAGTEEMGRQSEQVH